MEPSGKRDLLPTSPSQHSDTPEADLRESEASGSWRGSEVGATPPPLPTTSKKLSQESDYRQPLGDRKSITHTAPKQLFPDILEPVAETLSRVLSTTCPIPENALWKDDGEIAMLERALNKIPPGKHLELIAHKQCDLALHFWHSGNKDKAISLLATAMQTHPQGTMDMVNYWQISIDVNECRYSPASLEHLEDIRDQLQDLSDRGLSIASWQLAMIHAGLAEGFELVSQPDEYRTLILRARSQFKQIRDVHNGKFPTLAPRAAFSTADACLHIQHWDSATIKTFSIKFPALDVYGVMALRDMNGFYCHTSILGTEIQKHFMNESPEEHKVQAFLATSLMLTTAIKYSLPKMAISIDNLQPDKIIDNLGTLIMADDIYSRRLIGRALIISGLLGPHSRTPGQTPEWTEANYFSSAHIKGESMGRLQKTLRTLHKHRLYAKASKCLQTQAELLIKHNEFELADIALGKCERYQQMLREISIRQRMSLEELAASVEEESLEEISNPEHSPEKKKKKRKKKKKKTATDTDTPEVPSIKSDQPTTEPANKGPAVTLSPLSLKPSTEIPEAATAKPSAKQGQSEWNPVHRLSRCWSRSASRALDIADYRREQGLYLDAFHFLTKELKAINKKSLPGAERIMEEISWTHIHMISDPASFRKLKTGEIKDKKRSFAIQHLDEAEKFIKNALTIKLNLPPESLPKQRSSLIQLVYERAEMIAGSFTNPEDKDEYLWGLRCMFSSLGHIYSNRAIFVSRGKRKSCSQAAREYYGAKNIDKLSHYPFRGLQS